MPENLKTLRRRIRSLQTTQQITRAMEMVSAAKLRRASHTLTSARPYAAKLQQILEQLSDSDDAARHPLFTAPRDNSPDLLVVFCSDRGLCGSYNANLLRVAESWMRTREDHSVDVYCVGRKAADHFRRIRASVVGQLTDLGGRVEMATAGTLARELAGLFFKTPYRSVHLVFSRFISNIMNRPVVEPFLPLSASKATGHAAGGSARAAFPDITIPRVYYLEPSPREVFTALLPHYLQARIHIVFAESFTSEHSARMMAMSNASSNCEELGAYLRLKMNKARQAAITKEMLEIVSGAEALKG